MAADSPSATSAPSVSCSTATRQSGEISIGAKGTKYKIADLCLEPKSFQIEQEVSKRKGANTKGEFKCLSLLS